MTTMNLLEWARSRAESMDTLLRELVEIESPSSDAAAVARLAERLAAEIEPLGLDTTLVPVDGAGPVLLSVSSAPRPPVMLLGHLDTVWPVGRLRARPLRTEGDALYGPGAFDMKGGLVVALFAVRALVEAGLRPPVCLFFTPLEEVAGQGYRDLMESEMRRSAAVLGFEPAWPGGAVKTQRKGSGSMVLRARGRAAHAGGDFEKGVNAILELARKTVEASALTDLARGVTVNVGVVRGGVGSNVVPDLAEAEIDFRVRTLKDGERVEKMLKALRPDDPRVTLEFDGGMHYPPLERTAAVVALYEQARAVAAEMGMTLEEVSVGGASEASFAAALGRPTLDGLGPDGDGAHADDEHVLLSSIPQRVALAAGLIARLAGARS
jgi:glutamate carboxypeptidase